jgi:hypothetical protein
MSKELCIELYIFKLGSVHMVFVLLFIDSASQKQQTGLAKVQVYSRYLERQGSTNISLSKTS